MTYQTVFDRCSCQTVPNTGSYLGYILVYVNHSETVPRDDLVYINLSQITPWVQFGRGNELACYTGNKFLSIFITCNYINVAAMCFVCSLQKGILANS